MDKGRYVLEALVLHRLPDGEYCQKDVFGLYLDYRGEQLEGTVKGRVNSKFCRSACPTNAVGSEVRKGNGTYITTDGRPSRYAAKDYREGARVDGPIAVDACKRLAQICRLMIARYHFTHACLCRGAWDWRRYMPLLRDSDYQKYLNFGMRLPARILQKYSKISRLLPALILKPDPPEIEKDDVGHLVVEPLAETSQQKPLSAKSVGKRRINPGTFAIAALLIIGFGMQLIRTERSAEAQTQPRLEMPKSLIVETPKETVKPDAKPTLKDQTRALTLIGQAAVTKSIRIVRFPELARIPDCNIMPEF